MESAPPPTSPLAGVAALLLISGEANLPLRPLVCLFVYIEVLGVEPRQLIFCYLIF